MSCILMNRPILRLALLGTIVALSPCTGHAAEPAAASVEDQLSEATDEFRRLYAGGQYAEALPAAMRVVELNQALDRQPALAGAYEDLGSLQLRLGRPADAEQSFSHAIALLEPIESIASPRFIPPLQGLAAAYAAQDKPVPAVDALRNAISISRRSSGLFNPGQLPLLDAIVPLYDELGDAAGSEQELRYAVQVVQKSYGPDDPRVLPAIRRLATWYDLNGRYMLARQSWGRAVELASAEDGGRNEAAITALTAIARSHRLQYARDPETIGFRTCPADPETGERKPDWNCASTGRANQLDRAGETAALKALELLDSAGQPPAALLVSVLLELGDWYMTAGKPALAMPYYERAWPLIPETLAPGEPNPLLAPVPLVDLPPAAAVKNRSPASAGATAIEFLLTVYADGSTGEIRAVTDSTAANSLRVDKLRRALGQAIFRPRFEAGKPVATLDHRHIEFWFEPEPADITKAQN
jgi:tetratricopeptide (TPR) repeat protein